MSLIQDDLDQTADDREEPGVTVAAGFGPLPDALHQGWSGITRSASRLDLVKYAAASGDFNPIHFDHDAARGAGLAGVVVHGLLMAAWLLQPVAALGNGAAPLASAKLRFRDPLFPAEAAALSGRARDDGAWDVTLERASDAATLVTARVMVREG